MTSHNIHTASPPSPYIHAAKQTLLIVEGNMFNLFAINPLLRSFHTAFKTGRVMFYIQRTILSSYYKLNKIQYISECNDNNGTQIQILINTQEQVECIEIHKQNLT